MADVGAHAACTFVGRQTKRQFYLIPRLVCGELVTEHSLALVSPEVDQNFHRAHVDFAFHGPCAAPLRDGCLGREQYSLRVS